MTSGKPGKPAVRPVENVRFAPLYRCFVEIVQAADGQFFNHTDRSPLRRMLADASAFAIGLRIHARFR
jgi:hypothetical protein